MLYYIPNTGYQDSLFEEPSPADEGFRVKEYVVDGLPYVYKDSGDNKGEKKRLPLQKWANFG